jgi:hypothetical protein
MDIPNLGKNGNVERSAGRGPRLAALPDVVIPRPSQDEATISSSSRETAARVETLAERARRGDSQREEIVAQARSKLLSGELAAPATITATAQQLLNRDFLSD